MTAPGQDFAGRRGAALVVGGNGGIGARVAAMLAERGATVAVTHRRTPAEGVASHHLDLGSPAAAAQAARVVSDVLA